MCTEHLYFSTHSAIKSVDQSRCGYLRYAPLIILDASLYRADIKLLELDGNLVFARSIQCYKGADLNQDALRIVAGVRSPLPALRI